MPELLDEKNDFRNGSTPSLVSRDDVWPPVKARTTRYIERIIKYSWITPKATKDVM